MGGVVVIRKVGLVSVLACIALAVLHAQIATPPSNYLTSYKAAILHDRPIAYWRLDETSGTVVTDISGGGWTGTLNGGVTLNQTGALADGNKAELFDGATGTYDQTNAVFNYPFGAGPFSVEFWFKTTDGTAQIGVMDDKDSGTNQAGFNIAFFSASLFFRIASGSGQEAYTTIPTYNDGGYHHAVCTLQRGTPDVMSIYVDGAVARSDMMVTSGMNITQSAHSLRIGSYTNAGSPNSFPGTLDDIAIYNVALSAAQVAGHYAARLYPTVQ